MGEDTMFGLALKLQQLINAGSVVSKVELYFSEFGSVRKQDCIDLHFYSQRQTIHFWGRLLFMFHSHEVPQGLC